MSSIDDQGGEIQRPGADVSRAAPGADSGVLRVAIQGERGSNSGVAVGAMFAALGIGQAGTHAVVACGLSAEVIERLAGGEVECAVLPIENSLHGSVAEHYDLLLEHDVEITGECLVRVQHHVIVAPGVLLTEVRRVVSHPVALSQCRRWLLAHPQIEVVSGYDTAGSVKELMEQGSREVAGIAPVAAAEVYGAEVLVRNVEDHEENYTRFYLLERRGAGRREDADKVSVAFTLQHEPGRLLGVLEVFQAAGMNLTRIESRPVPGRPWEYVFFVDARYEGSVAGALEGLGRHCEMVKVLGQYRAAS